MAFGLAYHGGMGALPPTLKSVGFQRLPRDIFGQKKHVGITSVLRRYFVGAEGGAGC